MPAAFLKSFVHLLQASEMSQSAKQSMGQTGQAASEKVGQAKQVGQQSGQSVGQKVYIVLYLYGLRLQWGQQAAVLLSPRVRCGMASKYAKATLCTLSPCIWCTHLGSCLWSIARLLPCSSAAGLAPQWWPLCLGNISLSLPVSAVQAVSVLSCEYMCVCGRQSDFVA